MSTDIRSHDWTAPPVERPTTPVPGHPDLRYTVHDGRLTVLAWDPAGVRRHTTAIPAGTQVETHLDEMVSRTRTTALAA